MLANELSLLDYVILSFLLMDCNCHVQVVHFGRVLSRMTESLLYNPLAVYVKSFKPREPKWLP